jgi:hypothetical protein
VILSSIIWRKKATGQKWAKKYTVYRYMHNRDLTFFTAGGASSDPSSSSVSFPTPQIYWDSDFETDPDPPDWRLAINQDELNQLKPRERKRQDVINGEEHALPDIGRIYIKGYYILK